MANLKFDKEVAALLVIDPYRDFISERGKVSDREKAVAQANDCVPHMLQVMNAARKVELRIVYALHRRNRPREYETWKDIAIIQKAAWSRKTFENGTWGGEIGNELAPQPGDIVALEHWCSSGLRRSNQLLHQAEPLTGGMEVGYGIHGKSCGQGSCHAGRDGGLAGDPAGHWSAYAYSRLCRIPVPHQPLGLAMGDIMDLGTTGSGAGIARTRRGPRRSSLGRRRLAGTAVPLVPCGSDEGICVPCRSLAACRSASGSRR